MIPDHVEPTLIWVGAAHLVVALACAAALVLEAAPIMGVHPALKPMKFGISIGMFLGTMAIVIPTLSIDPAARRGIASILSLMMIAEMGPIVVQALRGTTSHFNIQGPFNAALWSLMMGAIVVVTITMVYVAGIATFRPLAVADATPMDPIMATAWRAGLWLFLLAAVSGFSMGSRMRHSVGGDDGGPGLPLVNWSSTHGDLRVSHFVALHALQWLPLMAAALARLPIGDPARWSALVVAVAAVVGLTIWTMMRALASRPAW